MSVEKISSPGLTPASAQPLSSSTKHERSGAIGHAEAASDRCIGSIMKDLRIQRGLSIRALADRSTLSVGMVSQIERGLSSPSLRSLRLLAAALEVSVAHFFEPAEEGASPRSPYVMSAGGRRKLNLHSSGVTKVYLLPEGPGHIEMWEFNLAPNGSSGGDLYNHQGEKAGLVLSGRIRLWIDGEALILEEGDGFRFSSLQKHRIDNPFEVEARTLWIVVGRPRSGDT